MQELPRYGVALEEPNCLEGIFFLAGCDVSVFTRVFVYCKIYNWYQLDHDGYQLQHNHTIWPVSKKNVLKLLIHLNFKVTLIIFFQLYHLI